MLKTENIKKLFKFEWKKDLIWIAIVILVIITSWSYYSETKSCKQMIKSECFINCKTQEYMIEYKKNNPGTDIICDKGNCMVSGVGNEMLENYSQIKQALNMTLNLTNENNS